MKGFILFLIFVGLCAAGYYYRDEIRTFAGKQMADREARSGGLPEFEASPSEPRADGTSDPDPVTAPDPPVAGGSDPAPGPDPVPEPEPPVTNDQYAEQFPLPEFEPIEEVVGDWKEIPPTAFPQNVEIDEDVTMVLGGGIGRSVAKAGSTVAAIGIEGETLTLAPHADAAPRATIAIDKTNLKEVLTAVYENFKQRRTQSVLAQREQARREDMRAEMEARAEEFAKSAGEQPARSPDGTVPLMVASIQADDVTEFEVEDIDAWGPVLVDRIGGTEYWTGTVQYKASTIFGIFPAEAMALMRHGKVEKWIYSGSHEPVP
ncbi:hypothetical protein BH23VER1_BH23VER1_00180 [soil metagenome]